MECQKYQKSEAEKVTVWTVEFKWKKMIQNLEMAFL